MSFAPGTLVKVRGREWVVLPESTDDFLMVKPLGGTDDEVTGILVDLEEPQSARFAPPSPDQVGDHRSCRLLRDAARISTRAGAGPFRSLARIAVEPRPYQLVPLLMALKLDPVRLLVADDVGIGKTIEAALIARELHDRGEIERLAVLTPPHLAEQWQRELREKFHIDAELVLAGTAARLERGLRVNETIFDRHPFVIVSMDFIKSDSRRRDFVRTCPELVIVDEAHTCAFAAERGGARHQRHQLLKDLAASPERHMILVTATPHSGKDDAFRSLLTILKPEFAELPADLTGEANAKHRRRLAGHLVQRRRGDIKRFLDADTTFPGREEKEETYELTPEYRRFFEKVLTYARETVVDESGGKPRQRVRWWSALALLRALASSPAAAAATLRNRARNVGAGTEAEADEVGRRSVFDTDADESVEATDVIPGADTELEDAPDSALRRRLRDLAREADALEGKKDAKLQKMIALVSTLVADGFRPIIFCRFIPTADYLAEALREKLPDDVAVEAVTGLLTPADREARVLALAEAPKHVLVATDCLSEGINLQRDFDAVVHYDLSWSPTRHEQREGRVDRFGQPRTTVRVLSYWGKDNRIDGIVLDVLIRKHQKIRSALGVSVPVPIESDDVVKAVFEGLLLKKDDRGAALTLPGLEDYVRPQRERLHSEWDAAADREQRSRTVFAQEGMKVEDIRLDLDEARSAVGSPAVVRSFACDALQAGKALLTARGEGLEIDLRPVSRALRDALGRLGEKDQIRARFELPVPEGMEYLSRTHPLVEGLAGFVLDCALDDLRGDSASVPLIAKRCGVIRTDFVARRSTVLLLRYRFDLITTRSNRAPQSSLAEECRLLAFEGPATSAKWLEPDAAERLLAAEPRATIDRKQASEFVASVTGNLGALLPHLEADASLRAEALRVAHMRVRDASQAKGMRYDVKPQLPPDLLGVFVFLPTAGN